MSQASRHRRGQAPSHKLLGGLNEIVFILFCFVGIYLLVSLLTYTPYDPGISNDAQPDVTRNQGGYVGAVFADLFFLLFGYLAYLFPPIVAYFGWLIYQGRHRDLLSQPRALLVPGIGFILTLSAGCGLAIVHFAAESVLLPSHAGGLLGMLVGKTLENIFNQLGATLILLGVFFIGVTLLTGLSWFKLMDTLGYHTLKMMPVLQYFYTEKIAPTATTYGKAGLEKTKVGLGWAWDKTKHKTQEAWYQWQARRYGYEYDYEDEDDYLARTSTSIEPSLNDTPTTRSAATKVKTVEATTSIQDTQVAEQSPPNVPDSITDTAVVNETASHSLPSVATDVLSSHVEFGQENVPLASVFPDLRLLANATDIAPVDATQVETQVRAALQKLTIEADIQAVHPGPVLTSIEFHTTQALSAPELTQLSQTLATELQLPNVKLHSTAPTIHQLELHNAERQLIYLRDLLESAEFQAQKDVPLALALGKDIKGQIIAADLARIPHILIAGSHAQERDTLLHSLILSLLYQSTPVHLRLLLVDSVSHVLAVYDNIPHLLHPIITDMAQASQALHWCVTEMERRYRLMAAQRVRNIEGYNHAINNPEPAEDGFIDALEEDVEPLPYIIVVVHEIAELMLGNYATESEDNLTKLTQKARSAGIHLIVATQYPSVNVVTGLLKSHLPTRIALKVSSKSESRTVIGQMGAENLLGEGDMLYMTPGTTTPIRIHSGNIDIQEVEAVAADLVVQATPNYIDLQSESTSETSA